MKNALLALACTLGAVACGGENRPAEDPSSATTAVTTETTTTAADPARRNNAAASNAAAAPRTGSTGATAPRTTTDSLDVTTRPARTEPAPGNVTADGNATPPPAPAVGAPSKDNPGAANNTKDATNTKINDRDRHGALTPMDQGGGNDRDITAAIRRAVVSDGSLSFTAKNVKIITVGGKVTLRGPVKSDQEKTAIEAKAKAAAGVAEVDNQLEVKK